MMQVSRRSFIKAGAASLALAAPALSQAAAPVGKKAKIQTGVQLYSVRKLCEKDLIGTLKAIKEMGYVGVEFAGYYGFKPCELKKMLADNGLKVCGTHVSNDQYGFDVKKGTFNPDVLKKTCAFETGYGNTLIICPGGGNIPPGASWSTGRGGEPCKPTKEIDEFTKKLVELYNKAAVVAKEMGCKIGLHNHTWEHAIKMTDGTSFWDYFFTNTCQDVCMEQDVGWSTCAGVDCCEQYVKYPFRSPTLHAKENGMGKDVKTFDAILGQPGKPDATPVPWDRLFVASDKNKVEWYVVECERHFDDPNGAVKPSFQFLRSKGRC